MKATGIVRRIDDLGRVVIPKEIRRTLRIREGDSSRTASETWQKFRFSMLDLAKRTGWDSYISASQTDHRPSLESSSFREGKTPRSDMYSVKHPSGIPSQITAKNLLFGKPRRIMNKQINSSVPSLFF